jgi:hypothetical protein
MLSIACKNNRTEKEHDEFEKEGTEEREDGMERWMEQNAMMTKDPALGYVPYERLEAAQAYTKSLMSNAALRTNALAWTERGPNNVGGRTRAVFIDKRDATGNTIYAGGVGGGIWKCTNFKSTNYTWTLLTPDLANMAVTVLVQDPTTPNTMYAGTGEGWFNADAIIGNGIYKSVDGGVTWNLLSSTTNLANFNFVQDILITNGGLLFATTRSRFCNTGGGIMRSADGGTTWSKVLGTTGADCATPRDLYATDLEIASNGDIYASTGLSGDSEASRGKLYKSSATNGANIGTLGTWAEITPPGISGSSTWRRIEIGLSPNNNNTIYALCQKAASSAIGAIMRSADGGTTWTNMTLPSWCDQGTPRTDFTRNQCWYDLIAAVDPNNANTLIIGGVDMLKSVDGGTAWQQITQWSSGCSGLPNVHADIHNIIYYPTSSSEVIATSDGGIHYSADGGTTWANKFNNYNVTQYYACDIHPTLTNYFLAGAQDNGTQKFTQPGINATTNARGGDGAFCHIDQTDGQIQVVAVTNNDYRYSRDGGTTFSAVSITPVLAATGFFINPTEYDDALDVMYTSSSSNTYGLITGFNGSGTPTFQSVPFTDLGGKAVTAFKVDPNVAAGGTVWMVGSNSSVPVFIKVANANTTSPSVITSISPSGFTSGCYVSSIDVENGNPNHLLATVSNYGANSVLESTDGGNNWANIEGNLPDMPVRWGIFAPTNSLLTSTSVAGGIVLATETGVWALSGASAGIATSWVPQNTGFGNVSSYMLKYRASDRTLAVATHGRGLFTTIIPSVATAVNTVQNTKGFITYASANANTLFIKIGTLTGVKNIQISIVDMQGRTLLSEKTNYGNQSLPINRLPAGGYIVKIYGNNKEQYTQQFVK